MASSLEFVQYAADQMQEAGEITYRKMFGDYGIYCDGKIFGVICDDQLFVKITERGRALAPDLEEGAPYDGAKPHFLVEELEDREKLSRLVRETCRELPMPKPRKKKQNVSDSKKETGHGSKKASKKLDYKKEFPDLYLPGKKPVLVEVPEMVFLQVEGRGNPNTSAEYAHALELLYGLSYGIKMNLKFGAVPGELLEGTDITANPAVAEGNYVVPPLEGLWWVEDIDFDGTNITDKEKFCWFALIRQPDSITEEMVVWAKEQLSKKKPDLDVSKAKLVRYTEGLCAQVLHVGPYDDESETILQLDRFIQESGYEADFQERFHHEIYLGDPRRTAPERLKTVIRHPVKRA